MLGTDLLASSLWCANYCKCALLLSWHYSNLKLTWASWIMCLMLHESVTTTLSSSKCCLPGQWLIPRHRLFLPFFFPLAFKVQHNDSCYLTVVCNPICGVIFSLSSVFFFLLQHFDICLLYYDCFSAMYFSGGRVVFRIIVMNCLLHLLSAPGCQPSC